MSATSTTASSFVKRTPLWITILGVLIGVGFAAKSCNKKAETTLAARTHASAPAGPTAAPDISNGTLQVPEEMKCKGPNTVLASLAPNAMFTYYSPNDPHVASELYPSPESGNIVLCVHGEQKGADCADKDHPILRRSASYYDVYNISSVAYGFKCAYVPTP